MQLNWRSWGSYLLDGVGILLFVDLLLVWHRTTVSVAGALEVENEASAWAGWGAVAGVLLAALLVWEGLRLSGADLAQRATAPTLSFWLALGVATFTAIEFFSGSVSTYVGSTVLVDMHGRQWPAYVGLALAGLLALAAVAQLVQTAERHGSRLGLGVR